MGGDERLHDEHRKRLRGKFVRNGLEGFDEHQVLELLLTFAIPRRDVNPLAHVLMNRFGSLGEVLGADFCELTEVAGVGENTAALLTLIMPTFRYALAHQKERVSLSRTSDSMEYCTSYLRGYKSERFIIVMLDSKLRAISTVTVAVGHVDMINIDMRTVLECVSRSGAMAVLLAHNHPSGDPQPSAADVETTQRILNALSVVGVRVVDHIIVGDSSSYSFFANMQMMQRESENSVTPARIGQGEMSVYSL